MGYFKDQNIAELQLREEQEKEFQKLQPYLGYEFIHQEKPAVQDLSNVVILAERFRDNQRHVQIVRAN